MRTRRDNLGEEIARIWAGCCNYKVFVAAISGDGPVAQSLLLFCVGLRSIFQALQTRLCTQLYTIPFATDRT